MKPKFPETKKALNALRTALTQWDWHLSDAGYPAREGTFVRVLSGGTPPCRHMIETVSVLLKINRRDISPDHEFWIMDECRAKTCPDHGTTLDHATLSDLRLALDRLGGLDPDDYYARREDHLGPVLEMIKAHVRNQQRS